MPSEEITAMSAIEDALLTLENDEIRQRVLKWAADKFNVAIQVEDKRQEEENKGKKIETKEKEIPGIAVLEEDGTIRFTMRDIKAKSANDAAVRLTLVATYVHEKLTGNPILHRQKILVPLLEDWRINNGNSRRAIGQHRGILPNGRSEFKLDSHAKTQADTIIKEILNDEIKGKWNPNTVGKKVKSSNKTSEEK